MLGNEVTPLMIGVSALIGLLPDMDSLLATAKGHRPAKGRLRHHQSVTHTPLFYLLVTLLISLVVPMQQAVLFGLLAFLHLALDSWSTDDGIMWLWPLSRRQFSLFPRDLHAGGVYGLTFYRRHVRCAQVIVPELLFVLGGCALTCYTLVVV